MTTIATEICSNITSHAGVFCILARYKLKIVRSKNPHNPDIIIARWSSNIITGTTKVIPKTNLLKNVYRVDSHISLDVCLFSDSSDICIPRESEKASAIAITSMEPITARRERVPE